jgi:hypothetical protein
VKPGPNIAVDGPQISARAGSSATIPAMDGRAGPVKVPRKGGSRPTLTSPPGYHPRLQSPVAVRLGPPSDTLVMSRDIADTANPRKLSSPGFSHSLVAL